MPLKWGLPLTCKRRTHGRDVKSRVAMEAIHPIQVSQWKKQLLDGASELFMRGKKSKDKEESQTKAAELFQ